TEDNAANGPTRRARQWHAAWPPHAPDRSPQRPASGSRPPRSWTGALAASERARVGPTPPGYAERPWHAKPGRLRRAAPAGPPPSATGRACAGRLSGGGPPCRASPGRCPPRRGAVAAYHAHAASAAHRACLFWSARTTPGADGGASFERAAVGTAAA